MSWRGSFGGRRLAGLASQFMGGAFAVGLAGTATGNALLEPSNASGMGEPQPEWDFNWDMRAPGEGFKASNVTRHLILIRHGQYANVHTEKRGKAKDLEQYLTPLGRKQAHITGERLASWTADDKGRPIKFKAIHSSSMNRALETGSILSEHLPGVPFNADSPCGEGLGDPLLSEGVPFQPVPSRSDYPSKTGLYRDSPRIEAAFRKYFYRAPPVKDRNSSSSAIAPPKSAQHVAKAAVADAGGDSASALALIQQDVQAAAASDVRVSQEPVDEYEVFAIHGNVIRFFLCRALQIPPSAWLRMATYNCGITHIILRPNGNCSLYGFGDVGHLKTEEISYH